MSDNTTRITVCKKTADRLKRFGIKDSTYDSIINDMMDHVDECDSWWNRK